MYAFSTVNRVYISFFLFLCAAFFLAPTVANANEYWSTYERRMISQSEVSNRVNRILSQATSIPSGSTINTSPAAPTVTKNSAGGLSATTQNTLRNLGQPSSFSSTLNNSSGSAKNALKSCVRSPACAGRALGAGAVIYEGINAWKEVYDILTDNNGNPVKSVPSPVSPSSPDGNTCQTVTGSRSLPTCHDFLVEQEAVRCPSNPNICPLMLLPTPNTPNSYNIVNQNGGLITRVVLVPNACPSGSVNTANGCVSQSEFTTEPVPYEELDQMIQDAYEPAVSDAPIVLLSGEPETISLSTPSSAELPATTTTSTNSNGQTTTSVTNKTINYNVTNNNTKTPSINSSLVETTTTYDTTGNITDTTTSTTTATGVKPDVASPSPSAPIDFELPSFCSWASIVCEWIGWTKEGLEGEEPDLINLISEFEPDENQYDSGIGSGSCPAPMSIYLSLVKQTVEVSYQPFCDFLDMIRPLVIAGAWLLSAFMYVGVLRRG